MSPALFTRATGALCLLAAGAFCTPALAQPRVAAAAQAFQGGTQATVAAGSSDYGTAILGQLSGPMGFTLLPGLFRWEAQLASWGSENYMQFGNQYKRSAWSLGMSATPHFPIAPNVMVFAKLGVHYLKSEASGPGLAQTESGAELGAGIGLRWQAMPGMSLKLELQNVGGGRGDLATLGLQFPI